MVNTIDDDYRLLERIRRGEGLEPLHDTNCDNSRQRSENDANQKVIHIDPSAQRQILENQEVMLSALYRLMQSSTDRVINNQEWRRDMRRLADEYHHTRKILGKDYIER